MSLPSLPPIDERQTLRNARRLIDQFIIAYSHFDSSTAPRITADYHLVPDMEMEWVATTNEASNMIEPCVALVKQFSERFQRLDQQTRQIIVEAYMRSWSIVKMAQAHYWSESTTTRMRRKALLAFARVFCCESIEKP